MPTLIDEVRSCRACGARFACQRVSDRRGPRYCEQCRVLTRYQRYRIHQLGSPLLRDRLWEKRIQAMHARTMPSGHAVVLDDLLLF